MFEWIGAVILAAFLAYLEWGRPPHSGSIPSGFFGVFAVFFTLGYLLGSGATLQEVAALWFVTAAGFAAGFLRDQIKQST